MLSEHIVFAKTSMDGGIRQWYHFYGDPSVGNWRKGDCTQQVYASSIRSPHASASHRAASSRYQIEGLLLGQNCQVVESGTLHYCLTCIPSICEHRSINRPSLLPLSGQFILQRFQHTAVKDGPPRFTRLSVDHPPYFRMPE